MTTEEKTQQELELLETAYRQKFPNAQGFDRFSFSPKNLVELLLQANGREIVLNYEEGILDGGAYSFKETVYPITLQELLYSRNLPSNARTKLVRHRDTTGTIEVDGSRFTLDDLYHRHPEKFMAYQQEQKKPVFHNCDYIVTCLGETGSRARFVGVYRVNYTEVERDPTDSYLYNLTKVVGFEALEERVIIDWGKAALSWHQWLKTDAPKTVLEIQASKFDIPFTDYLDFTLSFSQLQKLVATQTPRDEWHRLLSAVAGIYLILDTSSGKQYIGKASGVKGIWGRWEEYVKSKGHGGNAKLLKLIQESPAHGHHFQFTILMTLPKTMEEHEVCRWETVFMKKFGTRAHGLN